MLDTEVSQETTDATPAVSADVPQAPQITDLDGLSEFTFQGEKYNPDRLHQIFGEHKTYSGKISEYEKEIQYSNNLQIDLDNVLNDPKLADKFKATYPKKYHAIMDRYLQSNGQAPAQTSVAQNQLPKEYRDMLEETRREVMFLKQRDFDNAVKTANAQLDVILPKVFSKYDMADEDAVLARAEALISKGQTMSEKSWERLARESHEFHEKRSDQKQQARLKAQIDQGKRGQDVGPGGATPGAAPKKAKNFDEAREQMLRHVYAQKNG